jgi:hypothetical protein
MLYLIWNVRQVKKNILVRLRVRWENFLVFRQFFRHDQLDIAIYGAKMIKHAVDGDITACLHENGKKTQRYFPFQ